LDMDDSLGRDTCVSGSFQVDCPLGLLSGK